MELAGDVSGLDLLDTCCAADARQSLSWANLGASVTGCDITPSAIQNATQTDRRIGKDITFVVVDAQTLEPIDDASQDLLYATYIVWLEDLSQAARTWHRVVTAQNVQETRRERTARMRRTHRNFRTGATNQRIKGLRW